MTDYHDMCVQCGCMRSTGCVLVMLLQHATDRGLCLHLGCRNDIRQDPVFRAQFHNMCANVGVDPLASNKGMWAQLLGFGDFYYELGVQIVEACLATRNYNGGFMELEALRAAVQVLPLQTASHYTYLNHACILISAGLNMCTLIICGKGTGL